MDCISVIEEYDPGTDTWSVLGGTSLIEGSNHRKDTWPVFHIVLPIYAKTMTFKHVNTRCEFIHPRVGYAKKRRN